MVARKSTCDEAEYHRSLFWARVMIEVYYVRNCEVVSGALQSRGIMPKWLKQFGDAWWRKGAAQNNRCGKFVGRRTERSCCADLVQRRSDVRTASAHAQLFEAAVLWIYISDCMKQYIGKGTRTIVAAFTNRVIRP